MRCTLGSVLQSRDVSPLFLSKVSHNHPWMYLRKQAFFFFSDLMWNVSILGLVCCGTSRFRVGKRYIMVLGSTQTWRRSRRSTNWVLLLDNGHTGNQLNQMYTSYKFSPFLNKQMFAISKLPDLIVYRLLYWYSKTLWASELLIKIVLRNLFNFTLSELYFLLRDQIRAVSGLRGGRPQALHGVESPSMSLMRARDCMAPGSCSRIWSRTSITSWRSSTYTRGPPRAS